jgi:5-methyltetrahydrofolate--homocysteine methyltransferase
VVPKLSKGLRANGLEVTDLGVDIATDRFVESVKELKPDILGLSALMITTMIKQREVIEALHKEGVHKGLNILLGGAPVTQRGVEELGADVYGPDASAAVEAAIKIMDSKSKNIN